MHGVNGSTAKEGRQDFILAQAYYGMEDLFFLFFTGWLHLHLHLYRAAA
jgi:hypothetical protein